jgi:ATP-dependent helicase/nuclease subunit A
MSGYEPIDKDIRDSIVLDIQNSHFITAGAGAGKTKSIVDRIVTLTTNRDESQRVRMAEIVAVTFTNKAAAELRNRVRSRLLDSEVRKQFTNSQLEAADLAVDELDAAAVGTIHSFAQRILTQYSLEALLPIGFTLIDTAESSRNTRTLSNKILSDLYSKETKENLQLLRDAEIGVSKMRELINQLQEKQPQLLNVDISFKGVNFFESEIANLVVEAHNWWNLNKGNLVDKNDVLRSKMTGAIEGASFEIMQEPANFRKAIEVLKNSLGAMPGNETDRTIYAAFKKRFKDRIEWHLNPSGPTLEALVREWLSFAQSEIALALEDRRDRGEIDFNDLLVLTHRLVMNNPSVREDMYGKFKVYVVDEFQDTDPLQWEIIRALVSDPENPNGVPKSGRLIVVGDPKQSIYRFRGADLETFENVRDFADSEWGSDSLKHLRANFRSAPEILDFVHHLYGTREKILGTDFEKMAAHRDPNGKKSVFILQGNGDENVNEELEAVAATIQQVKADVQLPINVENQKVAIRPAEYKDIALLIPARSSLSEQLEVFEDCNIPYTSTDANLVYSRPAVRGLVSAMKVLAGSINGGDLWWALKSPLFGLSDVEMLKHKQQTSVRWPVPINVHRIPSEDSAAENLNRDTPALKALDELYNLWKDLRTSQPSEILEALYIRTRMHEALDQIRTGPFEKDCVRMVILHAKQWEAGGGNGLVDYIDWIKQMEDEDTRQNLPSPDNQGYDAVTISTIHSSKGLEYPIVILGGMWNSYKDNLPIISISDAGRLEFKLSDKGISLGYKTECIEREYRLADEERHRLLYVGATRAEHMLFVSNHHKGFGQPKRKNDPPELKKCWAKFNFDAIQEAIKSELATPIAPKVRAVNREWFVKPEIHLEGPERLNAIELAREIASRSVTIKPSDGGERHEVDQVITPASAYGNAFHALMESLAKAKFDRNWRNFDQKARSVAANHGVFDRLEDLKQDALVVLDSTLIQRARVASMVRPEFSVMGNRDGKVIKGTADLIFSETEDSDLVLVDYKTNNEMTDEKIEKYKVQLALYAELLEGIFGKPVKEKYLLHVSDGVVHEIFV